MLDIKLGGRGRFAGGGFQGEASSVGGKTVPTRGPRSSGLNSEEKLVTQIAAVLDQRSVNTGTISHGLQTQEPHVQQYLMDIILELLNLWRINNDPRLYKIYPRHPLRRVYETADKMLRALE